MVVTGPPLRAAFGRVWTVFLLDVRNCTGNGGIGRSDFQTFTLHAWCSGGGYNWLFRGVSRTPHKTVVLERATLSGWPR